MTVVQVIGAIVVIGVVVVHSQRVEIWACVLEENGIEVLPRLVVILLELRMRSDRTRH